MMRRLAGPALATLAMLGILIWLGTWQVHRLAWKTALLADIDRGEAAPAIPLPADPHPFTKIRVEGRLREDLAALYGSQVHPTPTGPSLGAQLLTPLERQGADPIIVDRGWVPTDAPHPTSPAIGPAIGPVTIEGYIRPPEAPVRFGASDDPAARRFFALDPAAIGRSLGLAHVAPFTLVQLGTVPPGAYPEPATRLPRPDNNHLAYALTWYGLAVVLLVIFGSWARKASRA